MANQSDELIPENPAEGFRLDGGKAQYYVPPRDTSSGDLFIIDNSHEEWKALKYLREWCQISKSIDIATGFFEIGALLALDGEWQKVEKIRILMGFQTTLRTHQAIRKAREAVLADLNKSTEEEKKSNDFLTGLPAIVEALKSGKIEVRVLEEPKFHAKAYITHGKLDVVGSAALVGSSNFTYPGLTQNIELNLRITTEVQQLQQWYEKYWELGKPATGDVLHILEKHVLEYRPYDVYLKALEQFFLGHEPTATEWEKGSSKLYPQLARYQQDGYHNLLRIAAEHRGAFLCDGVGLGKTFIGMMLIERLHEVERKNIALFVPKAAREAVWERSLRQYIPHIYGAFCKLEIFSHTDLNRENGDIKRRLESVKERADVILIDEAHHFRNKGIEAAEGSPARQGRIRGTGKRRRSRYRILADICQNKTVYLMTATPINNRISDFMHMAQLFAGQADDAYFRRIGIHSLRGHFNALERQIDKAVAAEEAGKTPGETNPENLLKHDEIFKHLVVQRSRKYVKHSLKISEESSDVQFPKKENPKVANYHLSAGYRKLLQHIDDAFKKSGVPIFNLAAYEPLEYYIGNRDEIPEYSFDRERQKQLVILIRTQFLKRFESSVRAFEGSCATLLFKLYSFWKKQAAEETDKKKLAAWEKKHEGMIRLAVERVTLKKKGGKKSIPSLPGMEENGEEESEEDVPEDLIEPEFLEEIELLDPEKYNVTEILKLNEQDLNEAAFLWAEAEKYRKEKDDKLHALLNLLNAETSLKNHKVLIFTEFTDTARYICEELQKAGVRGVEQVDGTSGKNKETVVERFSPYYNRISLSDLKERGLKEIRVLISTDVLAEGLNLQDCTRLINYDIHWNPVRLMQRIGRIDRRLDPQIEAKLLADHPGEKTVRGTAAYWNFLPPDELEIILGLYRRVSHKTLKISKTQGIEGRKLLTENDEFEALREFNEKYEGEETFEEAMRLELMRSLRDDSTLEGRLKDLPGRLFSGKENISAGAQAVFFCYRLPIELRAEEKEGGEPVWSIEQGITKWYMVDLASGNICDNIEEIHRNIACKPETPLKKTCKPATLSETRAKIEIHVKNSYLKQVQAPINSPKPELVCWMEMT
jgi:superfamily II DNA or RNA helicase